MTSHSTTSTACIPPNASSASDSHIAQALAEAQAHKLSGVQRVDFFSSYFLNKPYVFKPVGEGALGEFDQNPLYRTDCFDCLSYVTTVWALACSPNLDTFQQKIRALTYRDNTVNFYNRLEHFMETDWNPYHTSCHRIQDITTQCAQALHTQALTHTVTIDKAAWLNTLVSTDIKHLHDSHQSEISLLIRNWKEQALEYKKQDVLVNYLAIEETLSPKFLESLPDCSLLEFVRPTWNIATTLGTDLSIAHIGWALRQDNRMIWRHASSDSQETMECSLGDYLKYCATKIPEVQGLIVLKPSLSI